jgi:hypothetical protein
MKDSVLATAEVRVVYSRSAGAIGLWRRPQRCRAFQHAALRPARLAHLQGASRMEEESREFAKKGNEICAKP